MAMYGHVGRCMVMYRCVCAVCRALYGYVGLCRAM